MRCDRLHRHTIVESLFSVDRDREREKKEYMECLNYCE